MNHTEATIVSLSVNDGSDRMGIVLRRIPHFFNEDAEGAKRIYCANLSGKRTEKRICFQYN